MKPVLSLTVTLLGSLCVAAAGGHAWAAERSDPALTPPLQYELAEAKTGRILNTVWGWTEPVSADPDRIAARSKTSFPEGAEWSQTVIFTRDTPPRCLSWEGTLREKTGNVLLTTQTRWVPETFPLLSGPFPPATYPMEGMGYALTQLGLGARRQASLHTIFGGALMQADLWIDGQESVQVPAGTFDCYRVHLRANAHSLFPNLPAFLRPVLSFFIPTYTLWLTTGEPQMLVKFAGQMGPPGSPELLMRLVAVGQTHP